MECAEQKRVPAGWWPVDPWVLLKELREGWPDVRAAKWAICLGIAFGIAVGFGIATLWWSGTTAALRERLAYWQDKAQGTLSVTARHLLPEQRSKLLSALKPIAPSIKSIVISAESSPEAVRYAVEFVKAFKEAETDPLGPVLAYAASEHDKGVMVGLVDPEKPSDLAVKFVYAMRSAGFDVKIVRWEAQIGALDFDLFIGMQ
jgi:hypothetical protein